MTAAARPRHAATARDTCWATPDPGTVPDERWCYLSYQDALTELIDLAEKCPGQGHVVSQILDGCSRVTLQGRRVRHRDMADALNHNIDLVQDLYDDVCMDMSDYLGVALSASAEVCAKLAARMSCCAWLTPRDFTAGARDAVWTGSDQRTVNRRAAVLRGLVRAGRLGDVTADYLVGWADVPASISGKRVERAICAGFGPSEVNTRTDWQRVAMLAALCAENLPA